MLGGDGRTGSFIDQASDHNDAFTAGRYGANRVADSHRLCGFSRDTINLDVTGFARLRRCRPRRKQTDRPDPGVHANTSTGRCHGPSLVTVQLRTETRACVVGGVGMVKQPYAVVGQYPLAHVAAASFA